MLRRVADSANAAQAHYQIWFTLRGAGQALPEYYQEMNNGSYVDFFHAANSGNYKLMYIELGCLFDTDPKSTSIRNLKALLTEQGHNHYVNKIDAELREFASLVPKMLTIRSKLIAHKEFGASSEKIHQKYGVIPNEIGRLLDNVCGLLNDINAALFDSGGSLIAVASKRYERATFALLKTLRKAGS